VDAPPPSWYPDPQRDGMLRWWDGAHWTANVQPARVQGKPVLGQEVTGGIGPITFYAPGEEITHAYPPITDQRYEGIELAELLAEQARAGSHGGDVRVSAEHQAAVEAVYQLRRKGGMLGALAGLGEQLLVDAMNDVSPQRARPAAAVPDQDGIVAYGASSPADWVPAAPAPATDAGVEPVAAVRRSPAEDGRPAHGAETGLVTAPPHGDSAWGGVAAGDYRAASAAIRAGATIVGLWGLISSLGAALVVMLVGVVIAVAVPSGDGPGWIVWVFPLVGAVGVVLTVRELVGRVRGSRL